MTARSLRRGSALEHQPLQALSGPGDVDVALRVRGDQVTADHAGHIDRSDAVERLAVEDRDVLAGADIEELLVRIGRQGDAVCERRGTIEVLLDELAVV